MRVSFFGRLADVLDRRTLDNAPDDLADGAALRDWLVQHYPQIGALMMHPGTRLMLDNEITDWQAALDGAEDISIIPIVSGG